MAMIDPLNDLELQLYYGSILGLQDNWDGEDAIGYSIETVRTAVMICKYIFHETGIELWPYIEIGPDGSIDIHTHFVGGWALLINVDANPESDISYYGDNGVGKHVIRSEMYNQTEIKYEKLISWLRGRTCIETH